MRLLFLLLFSCPAVLAQPTGSITGRVVDDLGDPLPGANVIVEGTQVGAATDADGRYLISDVPVGMYSVTASFVGYPAQTHEGFRVHESRPLRLDFMLDGSSSLFPGYGGCYTKSGCFVTVSRSVGVGTPCMVSLRRSCVDKTTQSDRNGAIGYGITGSRPSSPKTPSPRARSPGKRSSGCPSIDSGQAVTVPSTLADVGRDAYRRVGLTSDPMTDRLPDDVLADLTLLALVIAHGADADLDPREIDTITEHLSRLAPHLSGEDVAKIVKRGALAYMDSRVEGAETVVYRLAGALDADGRGEAYAALKAVAEADETMHPMESMLLRHVAAAWKLDV